MRRTLSSRRLLSTATVLSLSFALCVLPAPADAAGAGLDPAYGDAGVAHPVSLTPWSSANGVALTPDGGSVLVGRRGPIDGQGAWEVVRLTAGGQPDDTFGGGDGHVETVVGGGGTARSVAVQDDGGILVAGDPTDLGSSDTGGMMLARYLPDGTLDASFGEAGIARLSSSGLARGVTTRPGGGAFVTGLTYGSVNGTSYPVLQVAAVQADGTLDPAFGNGGVVVRSLGVGSGADSQGYAVAALPDGGVAVAGSAWSATDDALEFLLARFSASGELLGSTLTPVGDGGEAEATSLVRTVSGDLLLAGYAKNGGSHRVAVVRYGPGGVVDATFGDRGAAVVPVQAWAEGQGIAVGPSGEVLVGAWTETNTGSGYGLVRLTSEGVPDPGFDDDGVFFSPSTPYAHVSGLVVDSEGRALLGATVDSQAAAARVVGALGGGGTPPTPPSVSVDDTGVTEGDDGSVGAPVTVRLSAPASSTVTVDYGTADGSALAGPDYVATSGTVTFDAGQQTAQVTPAVVGDTTHEDTEAFSVQLGNAVGATIGDGEATVTVTDNDTEPPQPAGGPEVTVTGHTRTEGQTLGFVVHLSKASTTPVSLRLATADGSATAGTDYVARAGTVTLRPGATEQRFAVSGLQDAADEPNETVRLVANRVSGATFPGGADTTEGTSTITDDDPPDPRIYIARSESGWEGSTLRFEVRLSQPVNRPVSVTVSTADVTATSGVDYKAKTDVVVTFSPGTASRYVYVDTLPDTVDEADHEEFKLVLSNPVGGYFSQQASTVSATGGIVDDDPPDPRIYIARSESGWEGSTLRFEVRLSQPVNRPVSVTVSTADVTATSGVDYKAKTDVVVTFSPGTASRYVYVDTLPDTVDEADHEEFKLVLSNPVGGYFSQQASTVSATGGIVDDDPPDPRIYIARSESGWEGSTLRFEVRLSQPVNRPVSVTVSTADVTATSGVDYKAKTDVVVTFSPGTASRYVYVDTLPDTVDEADHEEFKLVLSNPVGGYFSQQASTVSATGAIVDDDLTPAAARFAPAPARGAVAR